MVKCSGIIFVSPENKILLLKRSGTGDHGKEWAQPGGHLEAGESPEQAALREFKEEAGHDYTGDLIPLYHTQDTQVDYQTFLAHVEEFTPKLNDEHTAFMWCDLDDLPNKLHSAVRAMLDQDAVKGAILGDVRADAEFKEADHPRAENGQFGSGGSVNDKPLSYKEFISSGRKESEWDGYRKEQNAISRKAGIEKIAKAFRGEEGVNGNDIANLLHAANVEIPDSVSKGLTHDDTKVKSTGVSGKMGKAEAKKIHQFVSEQMEKHYPLPKDETRADAAEVVTEMDIAKQIRDGKLTSPQQYSNILMYAMRITGTGLAYRSKLNEYVQRNPDEYLNDEFLERCNGLPVIWVHPEKDKLDSDSFAQQIVGTICLPYIKGDEVWGIAKIYDATAANNMSAEQLSTSPAVIFQAGTNEKIQLSNGEHVLIEGKPKLLDHLAIVENGVWDKGGDPTGVLLETAQAEIAEASYADSADPRDSLVKEKTMAETVAAPAEAKSAEEQILALLSKISTDQEGIISRLSALEADEAAEVEEVAKPDSVEMMEPEAEKPVMEAPAEKPAIVADNSKARLDAVESELAGLKANQARSDNAQEKEELLEAQGRADAVEQVYGDSAPRPLNGDSVLDYEKRMVQKHLSRSPRWKNSDIKKIADAATFQVIRDDVYADSIAAAKSCVGMPSGTLREIIKNGVGGRKVHEFHGSPCAWTNEFKSPEMSARIMPVAAR